MCVYHTLVERKWTFVKFGAVLIAMLVSTIPVGIFGIQYAMRVFPFWTPAQFSEYRALFSVFRRELTYLNSVSWHIVPVMGMLCGNAIVGVLVSTSFILKELE